MRLQQCKNYLPQNFIVSATVFNITMVFLILVLNYAQIAADDIKRLSHNT